jgi:hypothetical protein
MKKDLLLFTLVKVSVVKLPRSEALSAAQQVDSSCLQGRGSSVRPTHSELKLILFENTACCQVIIASFDGIVDSRVYLTKR